MRADHTQTLASTPPFFPHQTIQLCNHRPDEHLFSPLADLPPTPSKYTPLPPTDMMPSIPLRRSTSLVPKCALSFIYLFCGGAKDRILEVYTPPPQSVCVNVTCSSCCSSKINRDTWCGQLWSSDFFFGADRRSGWHLMGVGGLGGGLGQRLKPRNRTRRDRSPNI